MSLQQLLQLFCCGLMLIRNACVMNFMAFFIAVPQKKKSDPLDDYWCACVVFRLQRHVHLHGIWRLHAIQHERHIKFHLFLSPVTWILLIGVSHCSLLLQFNQSDGRGVAEMEVHLPVRMCSEVCTSVIRSSLVRSEDNPDADECRVYED